MSQEFTSVDPSVKGKNLDQRWKELEKFLKVAVDGVNGGSRDFARRTLGKGLFTFTKVII